MAGTIDMQHMRYINLFEKLTGVSTNDCFVYNNVIIFAVPKKDVSRAVGKNGANVKKMGEILRKKIKVVAKPTGKEDLEKFISDIVEPVTFNKVEIKGEEVVLSAGRQSKAALIGRGRIREKELTGIISNFFDISRLRIA